MEACGQGEATLRLCTFSVETRAPPLHFFFWRSILMICFRWTGCADFAARSVRLKNVSILTPSRAVELL